jgi:hypothetical protein
MNDLEWIKDLIRVEREMEEAGVVEVAAVTDTEESLANQTIQFLNALKEEFVETCTAFNQMRGMAVGGIKIYGISRTHADFMLFRNGYKLIFAMKQAGEISIRFQQQGVGFVPGTSIVDKTVENVRNEDLIVAQWGAFNEVFWTYRDQPLKVNFLVKHYLGNFIRESTK